MPQVLPLSANRVAREGPGHLAMPPCRLPMVHQPIRFHIVLHEALRVARGEKQKRETEREKKRGRVLDQVLLKHSYLSECLRVGGGRSEAGPVVLPFSVFGSEARLPESLRYFSQQC